MTEPPPVTYRKTKDDEWVVCGPLEVVQPGADVTVHLKDGRTKTERVTLVGRPFTVDGVALVYGHIAVRERTPSLSSGRKPRCAQCHRVPGVVEAPDMAGTVALVCRRCAGLRQRSYC